jgi:imidazoleglycerol-phosphate dehydratase
VVERRTAETSVRVEAAPGAGQASVDTSVPFLDHMLTALARYAGIDLTIAASGDLRHHIIEDVALTVGAAFAQRSRPRPPGTASAPFPWMRRWCRRVLDTGGRPFYEGPIPSTLYDHWMRSFCDASKFTLHLRVLRGEDRHHIVEAAFKALGFALRQAAADSGGVFSTKGAVALEGR